MVFMDHMMPVMDGIEATQEIRKLEDEYFKQLPVIEEINVAEGIENSGSKELFFSLLGDFYKLIDKKATKIEKLLEDGMLKDYTIEVHALKSTARMIGAMGLSGKFYELEQPGKRGERNRSHRGTARIWQ